MNGRVLRAAAVIAVGLVSRTSIPLALAADDSNNNVNLSELIARLERQQAQLARQQEEIDQLRLILNEQKKQLEASLKAPQPHLGQVAARIPIAPLGPTIPVAAPLSIPAQAAVQNAPPQPPPEAPPVEAPLHFRIGTSMITPIGFMDFTPFFRTTNVGSSIGTNFGSIPFNNTPQGRLTEFRESAQNSRIGVRFDTWVHGAKVRAVWESDFLGTQPGNIFVTSNSDTFRLRIYWVDIRKDKWEILGGQSWSMLTPNRVGLSPIPGDIFFTYNIDTNYQAGLVWARDPQFRLIYHPTDQLAMGLSFENPEQYIGGSFGAGLVTLPAALSPTNFFNEVDNGNTGFLVPNLTPDFVGKIAWDRKLSNNRALHLEVAGVVRNFRTFNPNNVRHFTSTGGGGSINFSYEFAKNFRVLTNNFWSDGGGRWIAGLAPDLIIRADGSPSPIHAGSTVSGFEAEIRNNLFGAYYGGVFIGRNTALDLPAAMLAPIGYGFSGSPNSQNRSIQEITFDIIHTFWRDPRYGGLQLMGQYSYLQRNPWFVAPNTPRNAHLSMVYLNLRYILPGTPPAELEK
jgi:hypothetical protein